VPPLSWKHTLTHCLIFGVHYNTYDKAGNLDTIRNFNGTARKYNYDNANRLISIFDRKSDRLISIFDMKSDGTVIISYEFKLDGNGNRIEITDGGDALVDHPFSAACCSQSFTVFIRFKAS